jgi:hypothetical protein
MRCEDARLHSRLAAKGRPEGGGVGDGAVCAAVARALPDEPEAQRLCEK